jgi:hypothetical protein
VSSTKLSSDGQTIKNTTTEMKPTERILYVKKVTEYDIVREWGVHPPRGHRFVTCRKDGKVVWNTARILCQSDLDKRTYVDLTPVKS